MATGLAIEARVRAKGAEQAASAAQADAAESLRRMAAAQEMIANPAEPVETVDWRVDRRSENQYALVNTGKLDATGVLAEFDQDLAVRDLPTGTETVFAGQAHPFRLFALDQHHDPQWLTVTCLQKPSTRVPMAR